MNLAEALAATDSDRGPRSALARYLDALDGERLDRVLGELRGQREAAHLSRALTLMAREDGVIGERSTIAAASITKWRAADGS